jgi:transcriptional regulator with XRE-family HTH domain
MEKFEKLKVYREKKNLTMKQVADYLGITESCYCLYENGKRKPAFATLIKIAELYECTVNDFVA